MERKKITFDSFIRGTICCVLIIGLLMLVERLSGVLLPFFLAWLIAYMIYPLVKLFQYKLRFKSRVLSIFCCINIHYHNRNHCLLFLSTTNVRRVRESKRPLGAVLH